MNEQELKKVFCIPNNEYRNFNKKSDIIEYINQCLEKYEKRNPIKKLKSGNMSMKEFRNNQRQNGYKKWE